MGQLPPIAFNLSNFHLKADFRYKYSLYFYEQREAAVKYFRLSDGSYVAASYYTRQFLSNRTTRTQLGIIPESGARLSYFLVRF